jgi:hypothetical protein
MVLNGTKWLNRFAVALGGFLIFVGIIIVGIFLIDFWGVVDFSNFETGNIQDLVIGLLLAIGLIDLVAGVLLWLR